MAKSPTHLDEGKAALVHWALLTSTIVHYLILHTPILHKISCRIASQVTNFSYHTQYQISYCIGWPGYQAYAVRDSGLYIHSLLLANMRTLSEGITDEQKQSVTAHHSMLFHLKKILLHFLSVWHSKYICNSFMHWHSHFPSTVPLLSLRTPVLAPGFTTPKSCKKIPSHPGNLLSSLLPCLWIFAHMKTTIVLPSLLVLTHQYYVNSRLPASHDYIETTSGADEKSWTFMLFGSEFYLKAWSNSLASMVFPTSDMLQWDTHSGSGAKE